MAQVRRRSRAGMARIVAMAAVLLGAAVLVGIAVVVLPRRDGVVVERGAATTLAAMTEESHAAITSGEAPAQTFVVHVDGAVASPGVYELKEGRARVVDAVAAAGGVVEGADTTNVNLAAPVSDGQKVHIPHEGEQVAVDAEASGSSAGGGDAAAASGLVNINAASAEELDALPGVGPSTATAIVEDREANGPFSSIEDLMRVSGIGEKKFAKLREHICV